MENKEDKWISVKVRLPEHAKGVAEQVIVNSRKEGAKIKDVVIFSVFYNGVFYEGETWSEEGTDGRVFEYITHWQPLPEPPKEL